MASVECEGLREKCIQQRDWHDDSEGVFPFRRRRRSTHGRPAWVWMKGGWRGTAHTFFACPVSVEWPFLVSARCAAVCFCVLTAQRVMSSEMLQA